MAPLLPPEKYAGHGAGRTSFGFMTVSFSHSALTSVGRNGGFKTAGVEVDTYAHGQNQQLHYLQLAGITGRGNVASGHLVVPVGDAPAVIAALQQALHDYHRQQGTPGGYQPQLALPDQADARVIVALPDGREVHLHRGNESLGTIVDVWAPPTRGGLDETSTFWDEEKAETANTPA